MQLVDSYKDIDPAIERLKIWFKTPGNEKFDSNPHFMSILLDKIADKFNIKPELVSSLFNTEGSRLWLEIKKGQSYQKNIAKNVISPNLSMSEIKKKLMHVYSTSSQDEIIALVKDHPEWASIDLKGETPLIVAASKNFIDLVKLLIRQGARVNKSDHKRNTALSIAVAKKYFDLVKVLLSLGADPNIAVYEDQLTPLMLAVSTHSIPISNELITAGARINKQDNNGNTTLMRAIKNVARDSTIIFLLDNSTPEDFKMRNKDGDTALMLAIKILQRNDVVQELLNRGAPITPEVYAAAHSLKDTIASKKAILESLEAKSANPGKTFRDNFKLPEKL
jgi:ankyrin repeat protein